MVVVCMLFKTLKSMTVDGSRISTTVMVNLHTRAGTFMMGSGGMESAKGMGCLSMQMVMNLLANTAMIERMVLVFTDGKMESWILRHTAMTYLRAKGCVSARIGEKLGK